MFRTSHGWRPPTSSLNSIRSIPGLIGLSTINYLVILDIHRCKITKDYRKRKATCLLLLIGNERWTRCSSPATLIFRSSHSFIWSDREGNRGGRDYIMHEREKNTERRMRGLWMSEMYQHHIWKLRTSFKNNSTVTYIICIY
jgi:hypothetical protein